MFMYLFCIYIKPIILSLFKIDKLNLTMYILTILKFPLKHISLQERTHWRMGGQGAILLPPTSHPPSPSSISISKTNKFQQFLFQK